MINWFEFINQVLFPRRSNRFGCLARAVSHDLLPAKDGIPLIGNNIDK
jgi:hypothetical protein